MSSIYTAAKLAVVGIVCLFFVVPFQPLQAEGTFELREGTATSDVIYLEGSLNANNVNYDQHRVTFLRVDIFDPANEVIDLYGQALTGSPDIQIWCPGVLPSPTPDAPYTPPTPDFTADFSAGSGALSSFADVVDVQALPRSISPVTYALTGSNASCGEPGVYTVRYSSALIDRNGQLYWDIRVRNTVTSTLESGRVWSDKYSLSMAASNRGIGAQFYVVAGEDRGSDYLGVTWLLDLEDINPFGFQLYANARGVGPAQYNYQSIGGSAVPQPQLDPQYPIYLNPPAKPVVTPGIVGSIDSIESVCTPGVSNDVVLRFQTIGELPYTIRVDENNNGQFDLNEVILTGTSFSGTNTVVWDGTLPSGAIIAPGNNYAIELTLTTGEVHFPFYDVEDATPGPTILPFSIPPTATTDLYYWDDSNPSITSLPGGGTTSGPDGSLSLHNWENGVLGYRDENLIDTWKYASVQQVDDVFVYPVSCAVDPVIGLAKLAELIEFNTDATADIQFTFRVENLGNVDLTNVQVVDDLTAALPAPVAFSVTGISATGGLVANPAYDGVTDTNLLDAATSMLVLGDVGLITLDINIDYAGQTGPFLNTATASGQGPGGEPTNDVSQNGLDPDPNDDGIPDESDPTPIPVTMPSISIDKTLTSNDDADKSGTISLNDTLTYTITVTNTGNVVLTNVSVLDPLITPDSVICPTLAPMETCVLVGTYTVLQFDVDAGQIDNTAFGDSDQTPTIETSLMEPVPQNPSIDVLKSQTGGPNPVTAVGQVIDYTIVVENDGNVTQTDVQSTDVLPDGSPGLLSGPTESITSDGQLEVGETWTYTISYEATPDDIISGADLVNTVSVSTAQLPEPVIDTAITPVIPPQVVATKSSIPAPGATVVAGQTLSYTLTVTITDAALTGELTLTDALGAGLSFDSVTSPGAFADNTAGNPLIFTLPVGTVPGSYSVTYTVTVNQDAAGSVGNSVVPNGGGDPEPECPSCVTNHPVGELALSLVKQAELDDANGNGLADAGEDINYTLTATNNSTVALPGTSISDPLLPVLDCTPLQPATLNPGEQLVCTGVYTIQTSDIDAGTDILNTATTQAPNPIVPESPDLTDTDSASVGICTLETGEITGTIWNDLNRDDVLDGGEPRLTSFVTLGVPGADPADLIVTSADLTTGEYRFPDVEEGTWEVRVLEAYLANNFNLYALQPPVRTVSLTRCGTEVEDFNFAPPLEGVVGDFVWFDFNEDQTVDEFRDGDGNGVLTLNPVGTPLSAEDFEWVDLDQNGQPDDGEFRRCGLADVSVELLDAGGNLIDTRLTNLRGEYFFQGLALDTSYSTRVDLANPANVASAQQFEADGNCIVLPGNRGTDQSPRGGQTPGCGATTPTLFGSSILTAANPVDDDLDYGLVCGAQLGQLDLVKELTANADEDQSGTISLGDTLTYTVTATNVGAVLQSNVIVTDNRITPSSITCPLVATGESCVLVGTTEVTQDDIDAATIVNVATAESDQSPIQDTTLTLPIAQAPAIDLIKLATLNDTNDNGLGDAGEVIEYELTATNSGNVTLSNVQIDDPLLDLLTCSPAQPATLAIGQSLVCTGSYEIQLSDLTQGGITNVATAIGQGPVGTPVDDGDSTVTTLNAPMAVPTLSPWALMLLGLSVLMLGAGMQLRRS